VIRRIYDQMPEPRYIISWAPRHPGNHYNSYAVVRRRPDYSVDVYVPAVTCPEALDGLLKLQERFNGRRCS
jgi:NADH-quinone oxidoreductase subunit B